jgi:ribosomal protein S27AE
VQALRAQSLVAYHVKCGNLVRPAICEQCGEERRIEAAHKDYRDPLDVRWLCIKCHREWDRIQPKGGTQAFTGQTATLDGDAQSRLGTDEKVA